MHEYRNFSKCYYSVTIQPTEAGEIFPKDEKGDVMFEDDRTSLSETWEVHIYVGAIIQSTFVAQCIHNT